MSKTALIILSSLGLRGDAARCKELGIKAYVENAKAAYAWDLEGRTGALPDDGAKLEVTEFDYMQENEVVYQENGVTVRSWPAIHSLDGSVSETGTITVIHP